MLKSSAFKIQVDCPNCNALHSVTSLFTDEACQNCRKELNIKNLLENTFKSLSIDKFGYINGFLSGNWTIENSQSDVNTVSRYKYTYSSGRAYCEECKNEFEESEIWEAIENEKAIRCKKCKHYMPVRKADEDIKKFHPKALGIINDSKGTDFNANVSKKEKISVVFSCMTCGAGLNLSEDSSRTLKCTYCDNENYLPDAIWYKLHPFKDTEPLFLILDLEQSDIAYAYNYIFRTCRYLDVQNSFVKHTYNFIKEYFDNIFISDSVLSWFYLLLHHDTQSGTDDFGMAVSESAIKQSSIIYFYRLFLPNIQKNPELKLFVASKISNIPPEVINVLCNDSDEKILKTMKTRIMKEQYENPEDTV
jgi:DNA-directed RNA polymerase subunit RPC12/RpoP